MPELSTGDRREAIADVLVGIVATRGLDAVSVRSVATASGVSIGAVQHHFSTKAEMLEFAFAHVVARTRRRLASLTLTGDVAADVVTVLEQLLPLDDGRRADAAVTLAFCAQAASTPSLSAIQAGLLDDIRSELSAVLGPGRETAAVMLLAVVDGLAQHETSAPGSVGSGGMSAALTLAVDAALRDPATTSSGSG